MQHPILGEVVAKFEEILAGPATRAAFTHLMEIFTKRARVLKSPPAFLEGAFWSCMRLALQEAECGRAEHNEVRSVRAWKLFLLLPRLVLHVSFFFLRHWKGPHWLQGILPRCATQPIQPDVLLDRVSNCHRVSQITGQLKDSLSILKVSCEI